MLIDFERILKLLPRKPKQILHLGACEGEENPTYQKHGIEAFFVEANPELMSTLVKNVGWLDCINKAVSDKSNEILPFYKVYSYDKTNKGCSSLLKPGGILKNPYLEQLETIEVGTITIDDLDRNFGPFDVIMADLQGGELTALKGGTELLENPNLMMICLEFTTQSMYVGDCLLGELDDFLAKYNFERVITEFAGDGSLPWGDCVFVRKNNHVES